MSVWCLERHLDCMNYSQALYIVSFEAIEDHCVMLVSPQLYVTVVPLPPVDCIRATGIYIFFICVFVLVFISSILAKRFAGKMISEVI